MPKLFERDGLSFQYPENWRIETEDADDGWSVHVQSPATAFMLLSYYPGVVDPGPLLAEALGTLKEMYKELETEDMQETIAGSPATGLDIGFVSLDFTNTCRLRGLQVIDGCLIVLCQCTDAELNLNGLVMQAICKSLKIDD